MFIVKPRTLEDFQMAMFLCSCYNVIIESYSNGSNPETVELHVSKAPLPTGFRKPQYNNTYHLCESAFQMNFHQSNERLCSVCKKELERTGEGTTTCGHLTFTSII